MGKVLAQYLSFWLFCALMATVSVAGAQVAGGTLTVAQEADVVDLDPHTTSAYSSIVVLEQIYDSLLATDINGDAVPSLAVAWEVSEDGLVYTFTLRDNLMFSNGEPLTADDVVYSLDRIRAPETASPRQENLGQVASIVAEDERTVVLTLAEPFAPLLIKLADPGMAIIPEGSAEEVDLRQEPIGAGPFRMVRWIPGESVTLERNPHYWEEGRPYLDSLVFRPLGDESTRVNNLIAGAVDLIMTVPLRDVDRLAQMPNLEVAGGPGTWYDYLGMNLNEAPFDDARVRQALARAVNRDQIVRTVLFGRGTVINCGPIPPTHWAAADCNAQYTDIEEARALLAEAGYADGFDMTIKVGADYQSQVNIAQLLQAQLQAVGVRAQVAPLEWGSFLSDLDEGDYDAVVLGWIGAVDPDDFLYAQFRTGERWNFYGYSNEEVDALLDQGRATLDQDERAEIYGEAQRVIAEDAAYVFLHINNQYEAHLASVQGYEHYPTGSMISLKETWIEQ